MSLSTVARDDIRNTVRSTIAVGVVTVFSLLVATIFVSENGLFDDPYRTLWDVQMFVALVFPLFLAPLTYLSVAGDRAGGAITFALGLPNTRLEYLLGTLLSRLGVAAAAVLVAVATGFVVAAVTFENAPAVGRFATFAVVTLCYALTWVGIFVAISASVTERSRAMIGVFLAYFLLVPFWFGMTAPIALDTVLGALTDLFGITFSESTTHLIDVLSPSFAYISGAEPVYSGVVGEYGRLESNYGGTETLYGRTWFNLLVMGGWAFVSLAVGYRSFRSSELA